ncbi:hypothetical protein AMTR_s00053p00223450 [Amborella trichopoda]|uniref:Uncharacterized protein n=1 Tax=Amborella trichopoda TaxID=13333 RepID=W1PC64_AMBTC|nr:hypothetical protein AMTR_s00053p00223450 [Amborella trichopoda]
MLTKRPKFLIGTTTQGRVTLSTIQLVQRGQARNESEVPDSPPEFLPQSLDLHDEPNIIEAEEEVSQSNLQWATTISTTPHHKRKSRLGADHLANTLDKIMELEQTTNCDRQKMMQATKEDRSYGACLEELQEFQFSFAVEMMELVGILNDGYNRVKG